MDELERRLRVARPISGHRDLPLTDRAKRELADLMLAEPAHDTRRTRVRPRRRPLIVYAVAVAAAVLTAVPVVATLTTQPARAVTPPMLTTTTVSDNARDVLEEMGDVVADDLPQQTTDPIQITVQTWVLHTADDGGPLPSVVVPENFAITQAPDGTRTVTVTAGAPIDRDGHPVTGDSVPVEGTPLWEEAWEPGEYLPLYPNPLPSEPAQIAAFFAEVVGEEPSAAQLIPELNSLLLEQTLSPAQESALLRYVSTLPDIELVGSTTDRLGRDGMIFTATNPDQPDYAQRLIVSPTTGHILATETIYIGVTRTDIASPSVVSYFAWNRTPHP
ncbi:hypothetical protein [uncultured Microbacterium sp.]|uniref:hypothetical protein n=1 Tax=uncultured Microbacterium sp. TaxID=191216 RepID=UPI002622E20E|nr:hypothetical protein [uncultured Microbacterium sp.]